MDQKNCQSSQKKIKIIADDLTGACDTAAKLCGDGRAVKVFLRSPAAGAGDASFCGATSGDTGADEAIPSDADTSPGRRAAGARDALADAGATAVAINTESRGLSPELAFAEVSSLARGLKGRKDTLIYKKIDSLFRGNVLAEIDALLDSLGYRGAIINAAFPGSRRAVKDGRLIAPGSIRHEADILTIAFSERLSDCAVLPLRTVREGAAALSSAIDAALADGKKYLIVDSETEEDLAVTAEAFAPFEEDLLPVGAAGFIVPLAEKYAMPAKDDAPGRTASESDAPLLFVIGTNNPTTVEHTRCLKNVEDVPTIAVRPEEISRGGREKETARGLAEAESLLENRPDALLLITETAADNIAAALPAENADIAACVTDIAAALAARFPFRAMVISGGTTAQQLLEKMGAPCMYVQSEYAPGVPIAMIETKDRGCLRIVTKSGGFGNENTLRDLKHFL